MDSNFYLYFENLEGIMPISDCEVRDPRIRRTRQLLQGALRDLMHTRSFEEISVQDIAEAATVNRATFYDHYTDKFALLDALIAGGFHKLLYERKVEYDPNCPAAAGAIILAACDFQILMHQGSGGCKGDSPFEPLIDAAITGAIRRVLARDMQNLGVPASLLSQMVATAASSAIHSAAKEWFNSPNRPSVEEIVPQILSLILPILQQAIPERSTSLTRSSS
jgi:AcrR family transcriptional regulator